MKGFNAGLFWLSFINFAKNVITSSKYTANEIIRFRLPIVIWGDFF